MYRRRRMLDAYVIIETPAGYFGKKGGSDLTDLKAVCHHSSHDDLLRGGRRLVGSDSGVGVQLSRKRSRISLQTSS